MHRRTLGDGYRQARRMRWGIPYFARTHEPLLDRLSARKLNGM
jgi:hypothetical protein